MARESRQKRLDRHSHRRERLAQELAEKCNRKLSSWLGRWAR